MFAYLSSRFLLVCGFMLVGRVDSPQVFSQDICVSPTSVRRMLCDVVGGCSPMLAPYYARIVLHGCNALHTKLLLHHFLVALICIEPFWYLFVVPPMFANCCK